MANKRGEALAKELDNPNVQTFLDLISAAEGTVENGYRTAFGGGQIPSLADHPRVAHKFKQTNGKTNTTTAAGRYQYLERTWDDVAARLGLTDFSERSQDLGAIELLRRAGALEDIKKGDFATALKKSGKTWASLPSSPYPQPKRSAEWVEQFLAANALENKAAQEEAQIYAQVANAENPPPGPTPSGDMPVRMIAQAGAQPPLFNQVPSGDLMQTLSQAPSQQSTPGNWMDQLTSLQTAEAEVMEPWEEQLLLQAMANEGDAVRNDAVASFFGEPPTPTIQLPKQLERTINKLIAAL